MAKDIETKIDDKNNDLETLKRKKVLTEEDRKRLKVLAEQLKNLKAQKKEITEAQKLQQSTIKNKELELGLESQVSRLTKTQAQFLSKFHSEDIVYRMKTLNSMKTQYESLDEQKAILNNVLEMEIDLSKEIGNQYSLVEKKAIPYENELNELYKKRDAIIAQTVAGGLNNEQRATKKTLDTAIQHMEILSKQKEVHDSIAEQLNSGLEVLGLSLDRVKQIGSTIDKFIRSPLFIVIGLLAMAVKLWTDEQEAVKEFRSQISLSLETSSKLESSAIAIGNSTISMDGSMESVLKTTALLVQELGSAKRVTTDLVTKANDMVVRWKVSEGAAAGFLTTLMNTGKTSKQAEQLADKAREATIAYGVDTGKILEDVANAAGDGYAFLAKYPQEYIKTAARARALGIEMSKVNSIAKSLLNFEDSIGAEMEASVITGKQLNLDMARYYALHNQTGKMLDEILKQNININDYNNMNVFAQESIARAVGMSVEDFGKVLTNKKMVKKEDSEAQKIANKQNQIYASMVTKLDSIQDSMKEMLHTIGYIGKPIVDDIIPAIEYIIHLFDGLSVTAMRWITGITIGSLVFSKVWKGISGEGIGSRIGKSIGNMIGARGKTGSPSTGGGETGTGVDAGAMTKGLNPSQMLAGAAAMLIVAAATWVLAKAMQEFSTGVTLKGVVMGIVSLAALVGAVTLLGILMTSGIGTIAILAGAAAMLVIGGAMWVLGDAMQKMSTAGDAVSVIGGLITEMNKLEWDTIAKVGALAYALMGLAGGIAAVSVAKAAGGVVESVGSLISHGVNNVSNAVFGGGESKTTPQTNTNNPVVERLEKIESAIRGLQLVVNLDGKTLSRQLVRVNQ